MPIAGKAGKHTLVETVAKTTGRYLTFPVTLPVKVFYGNLMVMRQVTIKDLAKKLNISFATVSRALRNAPDINRETKKAVIDLANRLHYEPNYIAQSLVKKQTRTIGVIVPSIQSNYFSQALSGMTDVATENNYYLMICQSNETGSQELSNIKKLVSCHVDGLLISISKETTDKEEFDPILEK